MKRSGVLCKVDVMPVGVNYFARDPLHSYFDKCQKMKFSSSMNGVTYFACDPLHSYFDENQNMKFIYLDCFRNIFD